MLRRHLNSTAGKTVGPTDYCDNAVVDRNGTKCIALFFSGSSHISAGEMVDVYVCRCNTDTDTC